MSDISPTTAATATAPTGLDIGPAGQATGTLPGPGIGVVDRRDRTVAEHAELETSVTGTMDLTEDSVIQIDLGPVTAAAPIRCLGRPRRLPTTGPNII